MPSLKDKDKIGQKFVLSATSTVVIEGMTFLRLVPHAFDSSLSYIKSTRHHAASLIALSHDLKDTLSRFLEAEEPHFFADRRDFLINDLSEIAQIFAKTHFASEVLVNIYGDTGRMLPFAPHSGLRLIYDTLPNEDGWAIFRLNHLRAKLSDHAIVVDIAAHASEAGAHDKEATRDLDFLARLDDYKRELSEHEYPGASEISPIFLAKIMDLEAVDFDQNSKEAAEEIEADKEEGQGFYSAEGEKEKPEPKEAEEHEKPEAEEEGEEAEKSEERGEEREVAETAESAEVEKEGEASEEKEAAEALEQDIETGAEKANGAEGADEALEAGEMSEGKETLEGEGAAEPLEEGESTEGEEKEAGSEIEHDVEPLEKVESSEINEDEQASEIGFDEKDERLEAKEAGEGETPEREENGEKGLNEGREGGEENKTLEQAETEKKEEGLEEGAGGEETAEEKTDGEGEGLNEKEAAPEGEEINEPNEDSEIEEAHETGEGPEREETSEPGDSQEAENGDAPEERGEGQETIKEGKERGESEAPEASEGHEESFEPAEPHEEGVEHEAEQEQSNGGESEAHGEAGEREHAEPPGGAHEEGRAHEKIEPLEGADTESSEHNVESESEHAGEQSHENATPENLKEDKHSDNENASHDDVSAASEHPEASTHSNGLEKERPTQIKDEPGHSGIQGEGGTSEASANSNSERVEPAPREESRGGVEYAPEVEPQETGSAASPKTEPRETFKNAEREIESVHPDARSEMPSVNAHKDVGADNEGVSEDRPGLEAKETGLDNQGHVAEPRIGNNDVRRHGAELDEAEHGSLQDTNDTSNPRDKTSLDAKVGELHAGKDETLRPRADIAPSSEHVVSDGWIDGTDRLRMRGPQGHVAGRYDVLKQYDATPSVLPPVAAVNQRLYHVMTASYPVQTILATNDFGMKPYVVSLQADPAHDVAKSIIRNMQAKTVNAPGGLKMRHPNMDHSFGSMFTSMPLAEL